ncbi:hypothetical protein GCM10028827_01320 [Mucilaginibacter myungsuensis]|uniref:LysE family transporter n=2 Tax=Mucilaginibacter myungsuensis TaxID=649104 RepID=A0A929L4F0_9SPHI|nr:LysE family transporter [Mucilaginibacter myungsuensis]
MIILAFFIGVVVNFIGYIPPGNINLTVVQITINRGMRQAMQFIIAFAIAELIFTFGVMQGAKWLSEQIHLDTIIDRVMIVLFGTLGTVTWLARNKPPKTKYSAKDSIQYGLLLGFINPMQIPFWGVAGTYLISHEWIPSGLVALTIFSAGSAAGAFICLFLYARFAKYIQSKFEISNRALNTGIAILFFAFAAYHVGKQVYLTFVK